MKKLLSVLLSIISIICLAFAFGGCGEKQSDNKRDIAEIKAKYLEYYLGDEFPDKTVDDITVDKYYGKFGDSYVALISGAYDYLTVISQETIKDLVFTYTSSNTALVLNGSKFYTLKEAYLNSILTMEDLRELNKQFPESDGSAHEVNGEPIE